MCLKTKQEIGHHRPLPPRPAQRGRWKKGSTNHVVTAKEWMLTLKKQKQKTVTIFLQMTPDICSNHWINFFQLPLAFSFTLVACRAVLNRSWVFSEVKTGIYIVLDSSHTHYCEVTWITDDFLQAYLNAVTCNIIIKAKEKVQMNVQILQIKTSFPSSSCCLFTCMQFMLPDASNPCMHTNFKLMHLNLPLA